SLRARRKICEIPNLRDRRHFALGPPPPSCAICRTRWNSVDQSKSISKTIPADPGGELRNLKRDLLVQGPLRTLPAPCHRLPGRGTARQSASHQFGPVSKRLSR